MSSQKTKSNDLARLCDEIITMQQAYTDIREKIHSHAWRLARENKPQTATRQLERMVDFFGSIEDKNEEITDDLADVCILIGEIYREALVFQESIEWLQTAIAINDRNSEPYRCLAGSYEGVGDIERAARCREQEIILNPGNYFAYLHLASLYEQNGDIDQAIRALNTLTERDPTNTHALHRLISIHCKEGTSVQLLRRRLVTSGRIHTNSEFTIWTLHMGELYGPQHLLDTIQNPHRGFELCADSYLLRCIQSYMKARMDADADAYKLLSECPAPQSRSERATCANALRCFSSVYNDTVSKKTVHNARKIWLTNA